VPLYDFSNEDLKQLVSAEIEKILAEDRNNNTEAIAFIKATAKAMKITRSEQAIKLLIDSSRISSDLTSLIDFGKDLFDAHLVIREWIDEVPENPQMVSSKRSVQLRSLRNLEALYMKTH
jgi:hypothetical protein